MTNPQPPRRHFGASQGAVKPWLIRLSLLVAAALITPLLAIGFVFSLPASLLDAAVGAISQDNVRLVLARGQVRSGRAELWVRDAARREWQPWMPVDWTLAPERRDGDLGLLVVSNVGTVRLDRAGLSLRNVRISLPPNLLLAGVNHPLARAPWRGDVELSASQLACDWAGWQREFPSCDGRASLTWRGMGSAILPLQEIGSYAASIAAQSQDGGNWRAAVETESGVVTLTGHAEVSRGALTYRLKISGESQLLEGLDDIAGPRVRRKGAAGEFVFEN